LNRPLSLGEVERRLAGVERDVCRQPQWHRMTARGSVSRWTTQSD